MTTYGVFIVLEREAEQSEPAETAELTWWSIDRFNEEGLAIDLIAELNNLIYEYYGMSVERLED